MIDDYVYRIIGELIYARSALYIDLHIEMGSDNRLRTMLSMSSLLNFNLYVKYSKSYQK